MHGFQKDRTPKLFSLEETKKRQLAPQMLLEVVGIDLIFLSVAQVQTSYLSFFLHTDFLHADFSPHKFGTKKA